MTEKPAVSWYEALNEQVEWTDGNMQLSWLADVFGSPVSPSERTLERFNASLRAMRLQLGESHFARSFDLSWLNDELRESRPQLEWHVGATAGSSQADLGVVRGSRLPSLRASTANIISDDGANCNADSLVELLRLTLLLQFAQFIGGIIDSGIDEAPRIDRCRGLYKIDSNVPDQAAFPPEVEKRWRNEIELLVQHDAVATDVVRCEYFFPRTAKGRFCSDSCRFSTFQITKQLEEPNYLADKQKRYRSNKKS
ncbi:MAG TPA: hypothetical protein V6C89_06345 [Drouetiella sp.]|jgi:hypothetical protein